jgi:hypothetical protein
MSQGKAVVQQVGDPASAAAALRRRKTRYSAINHRLPDDFKICIVGSPPQRCGHIQYEQVFADSGYRRTGPCASTISGPQRDSSMNILPRQHGRKT